MFHEKEKDSDYKSIKIDLDEIEPVDDDLLTEENPSPDQEMPKEEPESPVMEKRKSTKDKKEKNKRHKQKKQKKKGGLLKPFLLLLLFVVIAGAVTAGYSFWRLHVKKTAPEKTVEITIPEGATSQDIAKILKDNGLILYESAFLVTLSQSEYEGKLRYGTFDLSTSMSTDEIIEKLATESGKVTETQFTVPEGFSVEQIAEKIDEEGVFTSEEFLTAVENAAADFKYAGELPAKEDVFYQLQGFLYPDTYNIAEDDTADDLVAMMLDEFTEKFDEERQARMKELGMTLLEVVTEASIIEKETSLTEEMPTMAGVIHNRLAINMKLQMDSTVVYAMTEGTYSVDRVLYSYLEFESPYNTYLNYGLPVGPISNPSLDAIDGVLYYEKHNYLYFQQDLVKNDGSNLFFENYEDHEAAASTASEIRDKKEAQEEQEATTQSK